MKRTTSVDDYVDSSAHWRDELLRLRDILRSTALLETIKWGAPCYTHKGKNVVGMVAFKSYVGLWFHQGALLSDEKNVLENAQDGKTKALRQWRMYSAKDIKPMLIKRYVREAIQLVDAGKSIGPAKKKALRVPVELKLALQRNAAATKKFESMTPGKQREYADYISSAKREATRLSRAEKVLPLIKVGAGLHDKYRS